MKFEATLNDKGFEIKAVEIEDEEDEEKVVKSLLAYRAAYQEISKKW